MLLGMIPVIAGAGKKLSGAFTDSAQSGVNTTHTFTNRAIGAAPTGSDTRLVVVCVGANTTGSISSVTIGGNAATLVAGTIDHNGQVECGIYALSVASGTTATIVVSTSTATVGIAVFRVINAQLTPYATTSDTADPISMSLNTVSGGYAIACAVNRNRGSNTWTNITETSDADPGSTDYVTSAAIATTGSAISIGCTGSLGGNEMAGVAACFQLAP